MRSFNTHLDRATGRDLLCGLLFSGIALIGFIDVSGNTMLMNTLGRSPDPGPALLPLTVLSFMLLGGGILLIKGLASWALHSRKTTEQTPPQSDAPFSRHMHAVALLASLLLLPSMVTSLGFLPATWLFAAPWLVWLEYRRCHRLRRALLLGIVTAALLGLALQLIFITLLGVAL
ncbi:MAG: tripartite tricarboxylate transporter TctB family protein [Halomonas sp.]|nr:tripartite tricarboxylate transporter TctB family protein [Halomonas sp.]MBP5979817.1 tripartite tricarboxylate transporter TctB family protein [Halomonas sp.]